jgi:hypothetical protein
MYGSRLIALVSGMLLLTLVRAAASAELSWQGRAGCPDREELVHRIERALGEPLARAAPLHFQVQAEPSRSGVSARLKVTGGATQDDKERVVSAPDCEKLVDAVALTIALALGNTEPDGNAKSSADMFSTSARATHPKPISPAGAGDPASDGGKQSPPAPAHPGPTLGFSLWLIGDAGSLPSPGFGAAFGVELSWQRVQLRALATLLFEQRVEADVAPTVAGAQPGADLGLALGSVVGCAPVYGAFRSPAFVALCAGAEVGRSSGEGRGVPRSRHGGALWLAPRAELGAVWALEGTQVRLGGFLTAAAPLDRAEFVLQDVGRIHRASTVVGRASVGATWMLE